MNYSTLKKTVVLSCVSLMAVGIASAQTDSTKKMSDAAGPAKLFGGAGQYNTWSIGVNVGVTGSSVITGGFNRFNQSQPALGFGVSIKDQLSHAFGIQLDAHAGQIKGRQDQSPNANDPGATTTVTDLVTGTQYEGFKTNFISGSLSGVVNFGNISFLHRANSVNFYASAGFGFMVYDPAPSTDLTNYVKWSAASGHKVKEVYVPVGVGVKFRASDHLDFNVGYTENFVDGFNVTGVHAKYPSNDKYSYGYVGLEYTLGSSSKPSLEWANPVAMMYDELYDAALRAEVEALKGRVTNVENAVNDLKKDSDGDGVADQFDKCPNTPAGSVVDGSGCPIKFPEPVAAAAAPAPAATPYGNIQFEFDSSVLKTSSYPVLDATSADMRANSSTVTLAGYASSEGTAAHNMRLSKDRANSVKTYLVNSGVDAKRLKVKGFGETHPIADNSTEDGRVANRRVEMHK
ncbi:OmpA family protein [Mucilaginibacter flavidus]|uniref:OmpA family protein n=1 Tax=Mucilaginibacter flavidus TaxID=2949309 RepID=UPI002093297D|nr:OmpA family protein [Mucilaginibacter flavidus]MCO5946296.1 OmpA family protein [Mucilaginibacter flavidus]